MDDTQLLRYARHLLLDGIGVEGQQKLLAAHVLIVGLGGLGSPAAMYLASAGVGTLTLVDHDTVDLGNLQRQIVHATGRVGQPKVESARQTLAALNPGVHVQTVRQRAGADELAGLVRAADLVLDCCDNFATRHAVNAACVAHRHPLVSGAALGFDGQVSVYDPRLPESPCYACIFPPTRQVPEAPCATTGVFAPLVGIAGAIQAAEALKLLTSVGQPLTARLLLIDARSMQFTEIRTRRAPDCPVCGKER
ncbi:MAG: molybdopterin-synthase adenylyltransferase MoeB [Burkholderiaceae bacterium]|jgi:molybdopterin/thiamine biosynthesis adenylyltransferase|nr:molybdopterin-synthase adenylyltransferase MoeB [Burkholderiaceae bacterium]